MDFNAAGQDLTILQLHKWDTSEVQLNMSEFREAFISPTRELLLLLSHHYEALLLPLVKGEISQCHLPLCSSTQSFQPLSFCPPCRAIFRL